MLRPGDVLRGRYEIRDFIGRGGMADVYLALDVERQAEVAIKLLREDLAEEPEFTRRFAREAEALAKLDHPNIVHFYSFETDGRTAFIVMDYIRGDTLRGRLREANGPLPLEEVTRLLRQVGAALHYAHRRGIVHRDIKPANVMVRVDGTALLSDMNCPRDRGIHDYARRGRHAGLHEPRTDTRAPGGPGRRRLCSGHRALRDGHWQAAVQRGSGHGQHCRPAIAGRAPALHSA
jgi:serine/threonine protein kinase